MSILVDRELHNKIGRTPQDLIENINPSNINRDIQGCSVDLHIGNIYRPGVESGKKGSASDPCILAVTLEEGETALIQTVESFKLDMTHAAFVFPASGVSIQGLLMTNPGHVDPGYTGPLHVTVINMGRGPYSLQPGGRFLRAFIHKLNTPASSPPPNSSPVSQELLDKLAPDFLSVNARTIEAAKKEIDKAVLQTQLRQFFIPVIATIIAAILSAWGANWSTSTRFEERIKTLETANALDRIKALEYNFPTEKRLLDIENQLKQQSNINPSQITTPTAIPVNQ